MKTAVVIPAAGRGTRLGSAIAKQFLNLAGHSVLHHTISAFWNVVDDIIVTISPGAEDECQEALADLADPNRPQLVHGGATRQASVYNGIRAISTTIDNILVHDAARPLIHPSIIAQAIDALTLHPAVVVAMPCSSTAKRCKDGLVSTTVDRSDLWLAQTPQGFRRQEGLAAFTQAVEQNWSCTDDAEVMERAGYPVHIITGTTENIKITHPGDLELAQAILASRTS